MRGKREEGGAVIVVACVEEDRLTNNDGMRERPEGNVRGILWE